MHASFSRFTIIAITAFLIILEGCANTPSRFYILTSLDPLENEKLNNAASQEIAIEVGPIELPPYLDRLPILTRASQNEFQLSEFDLWAEPLEDNFPRVLAENISILIPTDRVVVFPWNRKMAVDFQVVVEVTRFDCRVDGVCILNARWSLLGKHGKKKLLMKKSSFTEHSLEPDNTARVGALNKTLTDLSREIALAIKALQ
jgi:uncharacterized protein